MPTTQWFLTPRERGNPSTRLDSRHQGDGAWTEGNLVRPLVHGATYFAELNHRVSQMGDGDLLMFADWRGDPNERLTASPGTEVGTVFAQAARRGVDVRGLLWRSHWDRLAFSAAENRQLGDEINDAGGQCILDMRMRTGGSHHQKFVVLRHRDRPERDIAYLGGIDLCHGRRDDAAATTGPRSRTNRTSPCTAAAHLSAPLGWLSLRTSGRAKRGARLHQSRPPGPAPDLHRGPVPLVARGRGHTR